MLDSLFSPAADRSVEKNGQPAENPPDRSSHQPADGAKERPAGISEDETTSEVTQQGWTVVPGGGKTTTGNPAERAALLQVDLSATMEKPEATAEMNEAEMSSEQTEKNEMIRLDELGEPETRSRTSDVNSAERRARCVSAPSGYVVWSSALCSFSPVCGISTVSVYISHSR